MAVEAFSLQQRFNMYALQHFLYLCAETFATEGKLPAAYLQWLPHSV